MSQKILDIYITFANNNVDNLLRAFNLIRCIPKKSEKDKLKIPEKFLSININNSILNNLNSENNLKKNNSLEEIDLIKDEEKDYFYLFKNKNFKKTNF